MPFVTINNLKDESFLEKKYSKKAIKNILKEKSIYLGNNEVQNLRYNLNKLNYIFTLILKITYDNKITKDETKYINILHKELNDISNTKITFEQVENLLDSFIDQTKYLNYLSTDDKGIKDIPEHMHNKIIDFSENINTENKHTDEYDCFNKNVIGGYDEYEDEDEDEDRQRQRRRKRRRKRGRRGRRRRYNPGFLGKIFGWGPRTKTFPTKIIDFIDFGIDIAGFIPGVGIPIDVAGILVSLLRGKFMDALWSLVNVIPVVGSFIGTPAKYISKFKAYKDRLDQISEFV